MYFELLVSYLWGKWNTASDEIINTSS